MMLMPNVAARSRFIVKLDNGEPSERYWLGLFREWLKGLQAKLDAAKEAGILDNFDNNNHTKPPELRIAYSLACSYGVEYDCSRVSAAQSQRSQQQIHSHSGWSNQND